MKRILAVGINARFTHTCLALRCLRTAALSVNNTDTFDIVEFQINDPVQNIVYEIVSQKPDLVLFSVYIWNALIIGTVLTDVHALLPDAQILLGGPEVYGRTWHWKRDFPFIAACVEGYGETAIKDLAGRGWEHPEAVSSGFENADFLDAGIAYKVDEKEDLENRYIYYESSRGCPYRCSYCLSSNSQQHFMEKPAEQVQEEVAALMDFEPMLLKFVDRSFNANPSRARALWKHLALTYRSRQTRFHFEIMPDRLSEEDICLLASLPQHLFQFEVGIQTIHPATRAIIHRVGVWESERSLLSSLIQRTQIPVHADMIVGLPEETDSDIARTFDALMDLGPEHLQIGFLKVLHGTEMRDRAEEFGIVSMSAPPYEIYKTAKLGIEEKKRWKNLCLLVESIANNGVCPDLMREARGRYGSWHKAYSILLEYCLAENFDIRTKNRERLVPLIAEWTRGQSGAF